MTNSCSEFNLILKISSVPDEHCIIQNIKNVGVLTSRLKNILYEFLEPINELF